jgi:hypothetical protein
MSGAGARSFQDEGRIGVVAALPEPIGDRPDILAKEDEVPVKMRDRTK